MKRTYSTMLALTFALAPLAQTLAGDAAAGRTKAVLCSACHGIDGNSPNPLWPHLAGQHAVYLAKQMKAFRDGQRRDPVMAPMAMALSDTDIEDLSAYYASQKLKQ